MDTLLALATSQPLRSLSPGEVIIAQGDQGGDLFVLERGELSVERDGVKIAEIAVPGALVGEMSVILRKPSSATVRASGRSEVRVIKDARAILEQDPALAFNLAWLMASRLDATSALLVNLTMKNNTQGEQGLLAKILATLHLPPEDSRYVALARKDLFGGDGSGPRE